MPPPCGSKGHVQQGSPTLPFSEPNLSLFLPNLAAEPPHRIALKPQHPLPRWAPDISFSAMVLWTKLHQFKQPARLLFSCWDRGWHRSLERISPLEPAREDGGAEESPSHVRRRAWGVGHQPTRKSLSHRKNQVSRNGVKQQSYSLACYKGKTAFREPLGRLQRGQRSQPTPSAARWVRSPTKQVRSVGSETLEGCVRAKGGSSASGPPPKT